MTKLASHNEGLDRILRGGFEEHSLNLIIGRPGTGKTILAESIVFASATADRKALYISTTAEPLPKLLRFAQRFTFFNPEAVGDYVIYESIGEVIKEKGLAPAVERIIDLIKEHGPAFLVIDSFKSFHIFAESLRELSRSQSELATALSALAITSFWVSEYSGDEMPDSPEFAVVDSIIQLVLKETAAKDRRSLRVSKLRGSAYLPGRHSFEISEGGLEVYPRLTAPGEADLEPVTRRYKTGIALLDEMVPDGLAEHSMTAVFGPSGIGKTVACLQTLFHAVEAGETGLLATLAEDPSQLATLAEGFGWDIQGAVAKRVLKVLYFASDTVYIDDFAGKLLVAIRESGATRVAINSLNDLESASGDPGVFHDFIYALVKRLAVERVSGLFTSEVPELFQITNLSPRGVSYMADNVVLLSYLREDSKISKVMTVVKTRATDHDPTSRPYAITKAGIVAV